MGDVTSKDPNALRFTVSPDVLALGLDGVYLVIADLENRECDVDFEVYKASVLAQLVENYGIPGFVSSDPVLSGFRDLHTRVGRSNRKYVSSPEALVSRFLRSRSVPSVNVVVDIYNLVSLQTRLALGAHDVAHVEREVELRMTKGDEIFHPLGASSPEPVLPGEYAYVDGANDVICRMEVLQVEKTKVSLHTRDVFYIVQGNAHTSAAYLEDAAALLAELTKRYCGGRESYLYHPRRAR